MIFDLHVHTIYSDGLFTPKEIIELAKEKGLTGIAITDHDTVDGIDYAIDYSKKDNSLLVISGIELACIYKNEEVHILGYFIDHKSKLLRDTILTFKNNRMNRAVEIITRLNRLGMGISIDDVIEVSEKGHVGRPHIARALKNKSYVQSLEEAFNKYLAVGMPAYIEKTSIGLSKTINLIHSIGGLAVLAHPGLLKNKSIIYDCIEIGIDGIELIHPKHTSNDFNLLLSIIENYNLIKTGGSDFHGRIVNGEYQLGDYYINIDNIPMMKGMI